MDRLKEEKEETVHRALDRRGGRDRGYGQAEGREVGDCT
jgi:hypothetical protein